MVNKLPIGIGLLQTHIANLETSAKEVIRLQVPLFNEHKEEKLEIL